MSELTSNEKVTQLIKLVKSMKMSDADAQIARDLIIGARNGHRFAFAAANKERADLFRTFMSRAAMILGEDISIDIILVTDEVRERMRNGGRLMSGGKSLLC